MPNAEIAAALKNWIPYKLINTKDGLNCNWLYLGINQHNDPFFEDTINKCKQLPENSSLKKVVSGLSVLPEWAKEIGTISPTAFIFHISRCGSTLISQLLAQQQKNIVLSEVPFFDALLRADFNIKEDLLPFLKAAYTIYGAKGDSNKQNLFIKTDSWHIHFYAHLRELYPNTPFIFLYRRPDEVLRSQQKNRGMQAIPGLLEPEIFGFTKEIITGMELNEYMAKVVVSYLQVFLSILEKDPLCLPVNYSEGAIPIVQKIAKFTGTIISNEELLQMNARAGFHGKYPDQKFHEPGIQEKVPDYLQSAFSLYEKLENYRSTGLMTK